MTLVSSVGGNFEEAGILMPPMPVATSAPRCTRHAIAVEPAVSDFEVSPQRGPPRAKLSRKPAVPLGPVDESDESLAIEEAYFASVCSECLAGDSMIIDPSVVAQVVSENVPKLKRSNSILGAERRRIWTHGPRPEYKKESQRYNLPARVLTLLRPGLDIAILPGAHERTRHFWEFCKEVFGYEDWQAIFTSGNIYNMDDDTDDCMVETLRGIITSSNCEWTLVPYCVTTQFQRWADKLSDLPVQIFGEDLEWINTYGNKGALHRHIQSLDVPSVIESLDPTIIVPKGYTCSSCSDLVKAYELIGSKEVVIKPIYGAAGEGIIFVSDVATLQSYDFPYGVVCLEEKLDLDKAPDGVAISPALHYNEDQFLGEDFVDQIMKGTTYMGWRQSKVEPSFQDEARRCLRAFIKGSMPKGPGGVDFLSVKGVPYLSDLNTGRFNGCHTPKLFRSMYSPDAHFYCWKCTTPEELHVGQFYKQLQEAGCAFVPGQSKYGVFPLLYLQGKSAMFIALAEDEEECLKLYHTASPFLALSPQQQARVKAAKQLREAEEQAAKAEKHALAMAERARKALEEADAEAAAACHLAVCST
ncbi:hypothetical protein GUITHDRAFT_146829 [Guillardia theta CCMP2712]|uniref:ATP-grasp domain-containing protein n=1 Tax=Guillardia theta (strain CCMP2712) TaxID=905079 RepID=L1IFI9_GUITC|nr:hypothetical protein GUITHDRAFT_146829 [Guillardia theta CCMP2712]EKX35003.1 hypothetical protein GUITHDRAFT_146829 [Guillardia theta CCMP2712]|eukprot:XP_005821983.1 hypothetical protein GUITHDRAFT_146829 [Guillardia theta CCMP2712]